MNEQEFWLLKAENTRFVALFFVKIKTFSRAVLEGWWYTGQKIRQIWAEWAVCVNWHLLNCPQKYFNFFKNISIEDPYFDF